ncbi:maleylpyruvate isomerase N-terminal domain-containing protein [Actinoplanes sp. NPDC023801]|uniref:maleylpyruvate isomerase N-terminal domain-containing protein n=1 Tax=Actinoplanes sp. NPDC023801 TaxID=3154595 RepID=UPI0033EE1C7E
MRISHDHGLSGFLAGLDGFARCAASLDDRELMAASRCTGWTVGDVVVHVHLALQEMLLGLVSVTGEQADTDASDYWRARSRADAGDEDEMAGLRFVRLLGAAYRRPAGAVRHLLPTVEGVRAAASRLEPGSVRFQGHVLATGDFLATWAVELAVHHLDLGRDLELPPPAPAALRLARRTVEDLAGTDVPGSWPDDVIVLLGAGRVRADAAQCAEAPAFTRRLPVLA